MEEIYAQQEEGDDEYAYEVTDREELQMALSCVSSLRARALSQTLDERRLDSSERNEARTLIDEMLELNAAEDRQDFHDAFYGKAGLEVLDRWEPEAS